MAIDFGRYQLLRKIASGGMGQVYLARAAGEGGFEKLLVLKRILPHLVEDEEFFTMFFDEARLSARLNHPNVVQLFDLGEVDGQYYVAMEYVPGDDLRRMQKQAKSKGLELPLGAICRIIADAAAGLDYAHKAKDAQGQPLGIVHRDVSPQNILVGFDGAVKLIDFGVAKAVGRSQQTATGVLKGKYAFMSPEQANGLELDHRSDVFALGIVLWESLTGQRLFKGENDTATMRLVRECQVELPSTINPALPKSIDKLVLRALQKAPNDRYPDAMAFRMAIEELILQERLLASSAHLVSFLSELYAERIAAEADPTWLDQLDPNENLDGTPTSQKREPSRIPSAARGASRSRPAVAEGTAALAQTGSNKPVLALLLTLGLVAGGLAAYLVLRKAEPPAVAAVPPVELPKPDPVQPTANQPLQLLINSEPAGAKVSIDGVELGLTPVSYSLPAGATKSALFVKEGFEPVSASLTAASGPELNVQLKKRRASDKHPGGSNLGIKTGR